MNAKDHASPLAAPGAQAAFVSGMCSAGAYAPLHAVSGTVRCVETHVSWVFLTGPFAYKVKKPVRLSFLDYSTVERRKTLCREELRLNRRHAPGLYVDVVPITGSPAHPRVGDAAGEPFEHALRMVQFDPALELGQLLLQPATVVPAELADLGNRLARMHASAEPATCESAFGLPSRIHDVTLDNFAEIGRALPGGAASLEDLRTEVDALYDRCMRSMELRRATGRIRECHGDLHSGNIVRWRGSLVAFDGLEFDPALRFIDVASDIAFLAMDLGAHGRNDLRRAMLDAWTGTSGDFAAIALLPYYETYRALVRAKVAALRGLQSTNASLASRTLVHQYLDWARRRVLQRAPALVVTAGLSGTGKTTLARRVAESLGALHVRSDVERKRLAGLGPLDSSRSQPDAGLYTLEFNDRTYARLRDCADSCMQGRENVVIDAANLKRDERAAFLDLASRHGARAVILHCTAPLDVLKRRIEARQAAGTDASEATAALLDRQPGYWEGFTDREQPFVVTTDTTDPRATEHAIQQVVGICARAG